MCVSVEKGDNTTTTNKGLKETPSTSQPREPLILRAFFEPLAIPTSCGSLVATLSLWCPPLISPKCGPVSFASVTGEVVFFF